jgi:WD40 repeat protein
VAVSPDRKRVAVTTGLVTTVLDTGTRDEVARIQLTATGGAQVDGQPRPAAVVTCVEWAPDGSRLLLCVQDSSVTGSIGDLVVVHPETGDVGTRVGFGGAARASALSPDGRLLAVASASRPAVIILDAETLDHLRDVQLRATDTVEDLSFSPDGGMLAVVGLGGLLQLVDPVRGEPVGEPVRFAAPLLQAEWLADGETVVVAALDGTVSLFDAGQGLGRTPRMPASGDVAESHVHLLPGAAEELVAFSGELPGRRYPLQPAAWLAEACAIVARDLTRDEWERYLPGRPYEPTCSDLR